jgi:hypothetical protein
MRPYGYASEGLEDKMLEKKLTCINHEFLNRPKVALSLMADTYLSNKEELMKIDEIGKYLPKFLHKMERIEDDLRVLSVKHKVDGNYEESAKRVLKRLSAPGEYVDQFTRSAVKIGASLYSTCVWLRTMAFMAGNLKFTHSHMHPEGSDSNV